MKETTNKGWGRESKGFIYRPDPFHSNSSSRATLSIPWSLIPKKAVGTVASGVGMRRGGGKKGREKRFHERSHTEAKS